MRATPDDSAFVDGGQRQGPVIAATAIESPGQHLGSVLPHADPAFGISTAKAIGHGIGGTQLDPPRMSTKRAVVGATARSNAEPSDRVLQSGPRMALGCPLAVRLHPNRRVSIGRDRRRTPHEAHPRARLVSHRGVRPMAWARDVETRSTLLAQTLRWTTRHWGCSPAPLFVFCWSRKHRAA